MKAMMSFLMIAFVLLTFLGSAVAAEMSGEVIAVDNVKGTLTLKTGKFDVAFDCETGSLIKDVKVGDKLTVEYKESGGKKIVTKVTPEKKKATGGY